MRILILDRDRERRALPVTLVSDSPKSGIESHEIGAFYTPAYPADNDAPAKALRRCGVKIIGKQRITEEEKR